MDGPREIGVPDEDQIIIPPTTPVNTDDNALPNADASGDSDDERPDETRRYQKAQPYGASRAIHQAAHDLACESFLPVSAYARVAAGQRGASCCG